MTTFWITLGQIALGVAGLAAYFAGVIAVACLVMRRRDRRPDSPGSGHRLMTESLQCLAYITAQVIVGMSVVMAVDVVEVQPDQRG